MSNGLTKLAMVALLVSSDCAPLTAMAAGTSGLQAIDPSQAKMDKPVASAAPPPSPNPLGRVNGTPVSGNRQPPGIQPPPYPVQPGYPYPPAGYQYPPGYGYPPQQGYPAGYPPQGYAPQGYAPQGYAPQGYAPQGYPPQGYQLQGYPPQGYPPQGYAPTVYPQGGYPPQQGYPPTYPQVQQSYPAPSAYPPTGYPQGGYPPANAARPPVYAPAAPVAARPPSGYPNENMIPDFNGKALPTAPPSTPGAPMAPPGGQGWATNVPIAPQSSGDEDRVMKLEQAAFGSTYPEHEVEDRVDHLEKEVLGGTTQGAISDRISKLENKLGGAGAFGHTNSPASGGNGRGGRSSSAGSQGQVPFPTAAAAQDAPPAADQQPMAAVAQSLGGLNTPPPAVAGEQQHVPVKSSPPSIPLPKASPAVAPKREKAKPKPAGQAPAKGAVNAPEVQAVIDTIPSDAKAGDYFSAVKKFDGETVARWTSFPITIKLPPESPESWKKNLQVGITEWNRFIPLQSVSGFENCDIEVTWVNHLLPGVLGITRLTTPKRGSIHVEIWMLRPTFYVQDIPEHAVQVAFMHELGHAIGIFGHSTTPDDLMASAELSLAMKGKATPRSLTVEPRDLNTLKHIYDTPALPSSFMLPQPIEWSFQ
ncbi:hypothetical protein BH10CYA1_BH10CYA1_49530 [soil metagenome]